MESERGKCREKGRKTQKNEGLKVVEEEKREYVGS